jgi:predicted outer membrane repeat protein
MRAVLRRAAFLVTAAVGASVLAAGMVMAGAGPAAAAPAVLYAYAGGTGSPSGCPQDTTNTPSAECSLAVALTQANAGDTIDLATPGSTAHYVGNWTVSTPGTSATAPVTIEQASGVSNPTLDGNHGSGTNCSTAACNGPVLTVPAGEHLALSAITIADGNNTSTNFGGELGGGLDNAGTVTITGSTFSGNTARGNGGAIDTGDGNSGGLGATGSVTVTASTFTGNTANNGGAIDNAQNGGTGSVTVTASTFAGNTATSDGGAIATGNGSGSVTVTASTFSGNTAHNGAAINNGQNGGTGSVTVTASTFSGNTADSLAGDGGAIDNGDVGGGSMTVTASTFSGNTATGSGNTIDSGDNGGGGSMTVAGDVFDGSASAPAATCHQAGGTWTDNGYNAGSDNTCYGTPTAPAIDATPGPLGLGTLGSNGGPTDTMVPGPVTPPTVIGLIPDPTPGLCPATDQRGYTSAANTNCDAGAVQTTGSPPALTTTPNPATVTLGTSPTVLNDSAVLSGGIDPGGTITFTLYAPGNSTTPVYTDDVPITGSGSYRTTDASGDNPGGYTPTTAGTYQWDATYSGDAVNNPLSDTGDQAEQVTVNPALYGFGGFIAPLPKSTLQKSGSTIPVKFRLTTGGQPISASAAAALAAAEGVKATLTGPGISPHSVLCTWNTTSLFFQCNIKTPSGLHTGKTNPYQITVYENTGGGFAKAPGTANPETIYFK